MRATTRVKAVLLLAGAALLLTGCGLRGDLQRAPPLFGPDRARYKAEQERLAAEAAAKAAAEAEKEAGEASAQQQDDQPPPPPQP